MMAASRPTASSFFRAVKRRLQFTTFQQIFAITFRHPAIQGGGGVAHNRDRLRSPGSVEQCDASMESAVGA